MTEVIEALLCAAADENDVSLRAAEDATGCDRLSVIYALDASYRDRTVMRFGDRLAEVAYRLIESSPALRREWFGEVDQ